MNYYIVCEGSKTEVIVYEKWITTINSNLTKVNSFSQLINNNFYILSGQGYPNYLKIIKNSIDDIIDNSINAKLIIIVDSENFTFQQKNLEIRNFIFDYNSSFNNYEIIVQVPCIEAWGLGNRKFISNKPNSSKLNELLQHYNVRSFDPEFITEYDEFNKAQTAGFYLKEAAKEKRQTYNKNNPNILMDNNYLKNLKRRYDKTGHIGNIQKIFDIFT